MFRVDDPQRNLGQVSAEAALVLKGRTHARGFEPAEQARHDAAANEDTATGAQREGQIARHAAEEGHEHLQGLQALRLAGLKGEGGDGGRVRRSLAGPFAQHVQACRMQVGQPLA